MSEANRIPKGETPNMVNEAVASLGQEASNQDIADWIKKHKGYEISLSQVSRNKQKTKANKPTAEQLEIVNAHLDVLLPALTIIHEMGLETVERAVEWWKEHYRKKDRKESEKLLAEWEEKLRKDKEGD